jgi:hypothetical protein
VEENQICKKQLREANHKEMKGFVSRSSPPLRKGYVSVEELVRELSHNKPSLFQPLSSFLLRRSFPQRGKITTLTNFPLLTTTLGASRRRLAV